jgi:hypothetical protein
MWNVNYPETPVARVFNFAPKDWRTKPMYNLKDQTDSVNARKLPYLLALASIEDEKRDNTLTIVRGVLDLDNGKIADDILTLSLADLIKTKAAEKDAPEQAAKSPETTDEPELPKKGRKRAVKATKEPEPINSPSEPEKPVKTEIPGKLPDDGAIDKLPWENEPEPAKPAGPTPEQMAEQAAKDNLLNDEIEL